MMIVREGECTFIQKANNGDMIGALAVIVVSNIKNIDVRQTIPVSKSFFDKEKTPVLLVDYEKGETILNTAKAAKV